MTETPRRRPILYLDVDGLILRTVDGSLWNSRWEVSPFAERLLAWAVECYRPVWLTARDQGGTGEGVLAALCGAIGITAELLDLAARIPVQPWTAIKTDGMELDADFLWLDDCPKPEDLVELEARGLFDRWIEVNTVLWPKDLLRVMMLVDWLAGARDEPDRADL